MNIDNEKFIKEPKIIARLPDGKALVWVGTFIKRILALEIESVLSFPGVQTWEFVPCPHNAIAASPSLQTAEEDRSRSHVRDCVNFGDGHQELLKQQKDHEYHICKYRPFEFR